MASGTSMSGDMGKPQPIPIIGLTGGIACGKSTVLSQLRALGTLCFDADTVYRNLVQPGAPLLRTIAEEFGHEALTHDGALNRPYLADRIFNDQSARSTLNKITHPAIIGQLLENLEDAKRQGWGWAVFEAAILVEGDTWKAMDFLVVVSAPEGTREQRIVTRDKLTTDDARTRIEAQTPLSAYEKNADHIVRNTGTIQDLQSSVEVLFDLLLQRFGPPK